LNDIVGKAKQGGPAGKGEEKSDVKITLYANGFCVDDGEFRDYNEPQNKAFMEDVKKGLVPKELANKFKKNISIGLEDKRETMFKPPPPPYVPFSGAAVSLGGGPA
jgi:UBX domain-containing protein 1